MLTDEERDIVEGIRPTAGLPGRQLIAIIDRLTAPAQVGAAPTTGRFITHYDYPKPEPARPAAVGSGACEHDWSRWLRMSLDVPWSRKCKVCGLEEQAAALPLVEPDAAEVAARVQRRTHRKKLLACINSAIDDFSGGGVGKDPQMAFAEYILHRLQNASLIASGFGAGRTPGTVEVDRDAAAKAAQYAYYTACFGPFKLPDWDKQLQTGKNAWLAVVDALIASGFGVGRTPGTVEVCQHYRSASCGENEDYENMGACGRKNCPMKAAQAAKGSAI